MPKKHKPLSASKVAAMSKLVMEGADHPNDATISAGGIMPPANNTHIDGDEARFLLQLITSKDNYVALNLLDLAYKLRQKLYDLHLNQPPKEAGK